MKFLNLAISAAAFSSVHAERTIPSGSKCTNVYGLNGYTTQDCESSAE